MQFDIDYRTLVSEAARRRAGEQHYAITDEAINQLGVIAAQMSSEIREYTKREQLSAPDIVGYVERFVDYAHEEAVRRGEPEITEETIRYLDQNPPPEWPCEYWREKRRRRAAEQERRTQRDDDDDDTRAKA
jgi:hypothetical protein